MAKIPPDTAVRCSHVLIKHAESRNPISRRTNKSTAEYSLADAEAEMDKWIASLKKDAKKAIEAVKAPTLTQCRGKVTTPALGVAVIDTMAAEAAATLDAADAEVA